MSAQPARRFRPSTPTSKPSKEEITWAEIGARAPQVDEPPVDEPPGDEPPVDEPPVDEPPAGEPIVDPPVDNPADPSTDETVVSSPAGDEAEVPLVIDAGAQASTSSGQGGAGSAPGLALFGALLALGGYLLTRSRKTGGAHRR